ncbi:MAG: Gfo/Idh/MocA family protein [Eubacteriales bacterium]
MLKAALIGLGGMGRGHFDNYLRMMKEGAPVELVAVCDINPEKFKIAKVDFNIGGVVSDKQDFSAFRQYTSADEMLEKEELDLVSIAIPTYLHCEMSVKCLKAGANVFCEKPMALKVEDCRKMIDTANACGKQLMIGQCLRFWGEYEVAKQIISGGELGKPIGGYFWRGGGSPANDPNNWYLHREMSGGCLFDQHVHDVDMIQYLYGMPEAVSSVGRAVFPDNGQDTVSTNYIYDGDYAVNAQDDWTLKGHGFSMTFRINFEGGTLYMDHGGFRLAKADGTVITPEHSTENAYYKEIKYLIGLILSGEKNTVNPPEDSMKAIMIASAEAQSADNHGELVSIK